MVRNAKVIRQHVYLEVSGPGGGMLFIMDNNGSVVSQVIHRRLLLRTESVLVDVPHGEF